MGIVQRLRHLGRDAAVSRLPGCRTVAKTSPRLPLASAVDFPLTALNIYRIGHGDWCADWP